MGAYEELLERLKDIDLNCKTPFEKLTCVQQISEIIKQEIKAFWRGVNVKEDKLTLDGD